MATFRQLLESLTSTGVSGAIPKEIRAVLFEENRMNNPLFGILPRFPVQTTTYYWVKRNMLPGGGASLEAPPFTGAGSVPAANSTYANTNFTQIQFLTFKGDVSKIAEQVATRVGSVIANEIKGQVENEARTETVQNIYGSRKATVNTNKTQWDGFNRLVPTASTLKWGGAASQGAVSTAILDNLYDQIRATTGTADLGGQWAFVMSPKMESAINQLFATVQRAELPTVSVPPRIDPDVFGQKDSAFYRQYLGLMAGVTVKAYRGCPLVTSSFLSPTGQMGSVTLGHGGSDGAFPGSQAYYYRVEAVTLLGRTLASAEVNVTPAANEHVTLTWSTPSITDAFGNAYPILNYRIYRGTTAGSETLYGIAAAYDSSDNPLLTVTDYNTVLDPSTAGSGYFYVPLVALALGHELVRASRHSSSCSQMR